MKSTLLSVASAAVFAAGVAHAGGIERQGDPTQILFEKGRNYLEFSAAHVSPDVSGVSNGAPGGATGNMTRAYQSFAMGYKTQINDRLALAFVINEPVGASVRYQQPGAFFFGSFADLSSIAFTAMGKYQVADRISVYGGLRYQGVGGTLRIQTLVGPPYALSVDKDYRLGYILGAAYEIPDIALRLALTYESEIEHKYFDNSGNRFTLKIPQSWTLNAQTGIAANTLLFGSVRWREWTAFNLSPPEFPANPIAAGTSDVITYKLGVGRKFSDNWSGAFIVGYEKQEGKRVGNLSGTDGYMSYALAATYETESYEITTAVSYFDVGSAGTSVANFSGNDAIAVGMKVGFRF